MGRRNNSHFAVSPTVDVRRSVFDRSSTVKTCCPMGKLIPFYVDEVLPGDTFKMKCHAFGRLQWPLVPFMTATDIDIHFWYVPMRILWTHFEQMMGDTTGMSPSGIWVNDGDVLVPVLKDYHASSNTLSDYFGLPTGEDLTLVNALPFRAYNKIYNEWYRDENFQNSVYEVTDDGPDDSGNYKIMSRGKKHDYFTSCLPWPQKGTAPGISTGSLGNLGLELKQGAQSFINATLFDADGGAILNTVGNCTPHGVNGAIACPGWNCYVEPEARLAATFDISTLASRMQTAKVSATGDITVNDLRRAVQVQRMMEKEARGGTRYTEIIRSHFGVTSPDARLQRPEYLGGTSSQLRLNPVAQTSSATATSPQANLSAYGVYSNSFNGFVKSFTEHGYIIGIVSSRVDQAYQNGMEKLWSRRSKYDFYWPAFAHLGEQPVLVQELDWKESATDNAKVFGYQERYAEYRYKPSRVTGQFKSCWTGGAGTLHKWHLAQDIGESVVSNGDAFIKEDAPWDRVLAFSTSTYQPLMLDIHMDLRCVRPMPVFSIPGMMDHF